MSKQPQSELFDIAQIAAKLGDGFIPTSSEEAQWLEEVTSIPNANIQEKALSSARAQGEPSAAWHFAGSQFLG